MAVNWKLLAAAVLSFPRISVRALISRPTRLQGRPGGTQTSVTSSRLARVPSTRSSAALVKIRRVDEKFVGNHDAMLACLRSPATRVRGESEGARIVSFWKCLVVFSEDDGC